MIVKIINIVFTFKNISGQVTRDKTVEKINKMIIIRNVNFSYFLSVLQGTLKDYFVKVLK